MCAEGLLKITQKFFGGSGYGQLTVIGNCELPFRELFFQFHYKQAVGHMLHAVVRDKCKSQADSGKVDQQVIAAKFSLGNQIQFMMQKQGK